MNTDHLPETELRRRLQDAATKVEVGARYAHYKNPDLTYKVTQLVIWEATDEVAVTYEAEYGEHITYVRTLEVWLDVVEWEGATVPRFTKIRSE